MTSLCALAVAITASALAYLAASDPKRRRAFRLTPWTRPRHSATAWCLALAPGLVLLLFDTAAGFVLWFGAVTVIGWSISAMNPARMGSLSQAAARVRHALRERLGRHILDRRPFRSRSSAKQKRRLDLLEQRVSQLESHLAATRRDH